MEKYYIKSIIGRIAEGIQSLVDKGIVEEGKQVIIYGLDRYAFAIRTILSNLGFHNVECFISEDMALVGEHLRKLNDFSSHYLNSTDGLINVYSLAERLKEYDEKIVMLMATERYQEVVALLEAYGYTEKNYHVLYDFCEPQIEQQILGKKRMSLSEVKAAEEQILAFVDSFCDERKIRYWVCGGTQLGTIRHKGFIPWDDDIDIYMPWEDYKRFISEFRESEEYCIWGFGGEENDFPDPLFKVCDKRTIVVENIGTVKKVNPVWVDVFPLIGLPSNELERKCFFANYQELNRKIWQNFYANNGDVSVFARWYDKQIEFMKQYDFDNSDYVGVLGTAYKDRDHTQRNVYDKTIRMPFEGISVNVPAGYKEYLTNLYGSDYMQLPPVEKRKTHHTLEAYWK